ncbi:hypothetical protein [Natrinema sp. H-ect4]|uniref:hypothetical protein n=1 Tax=Natrinema sp. H-ect4 TaxID=3242699 RepID=UPI0035A8407F
MKMKGEPEILHEVPVDRIESRNLPEDARSLLLEVGLQYFSPRKTGELFQHLEENSLSPSRVKALRVESRLLGRFPTGSEDVFNRAAQLQRQKDGDEGVRKGVEPEYVIVVAPLNQGVGGEASVEDTVEQLRAVQEMIEEVEEPVDFTGTVLLENRPDSVFSNVEDLHCFRERASDQGFDLLYSLNLAVEGGRELLGVAFSSEIELMRMSRLGD